MLNIARHMLANIQALHGKADEAAERGLYSLAESLRLRADRVCNVASEAHRLYALELPIHPDATEEPWESKAAGLLAAASGYSSVYGEVYSLSN